jgi:predicted dehydrogenase
MSKSKIQSGPVKIELVPGALTRRRFLYATALAAGSVAVAGPVMAPVKLKSAAEKLDVGIIGCGGQGEKDSQSMSSENIVALCDVDADALAKAAAKWPRARRYRDYRILLEQEKALDAVTVTIPDHQHAPAAMMAIKSGKHVYCQKPLAHTVSEARALARAAREHKVVTQMGNQGHSGEGNRLLCEMVWSGVIGPVREVHCWTNKPTWPQGLERPGTQEAVPSNLDWDLWIGPAPMRPFVSHWPPEVPRQRGGVYHPFGWRAWWDFGCGVLGDMGCHIMDGAYWALKLGAPTSVELVDASPVLPEMAPQWSVIRYHFPARREMPACTLTWHDGGKLPSRPEEMESGEFESAGALLIWDKGKILTGQYGGHPRLLPESRMIDYKRPEPVIPRVPGNNPFKDFIRACKGGPPACSNFEVSGPFTELVLLGNVALRLGRTIEWDADRMRVANCPDAGRLVHSEYRKGWTV